jgi:hypothetical protein
MRVHVNTFDKTTICKNISSIQLAPNENGKTVDGYRAMALERLGWAHNSR